MSFLKQREGNNLTVPEQVATWLSIGTMLWWAGLFVAWRYKKAAVEEERELEATEKKLFHEQELAAQRKQRQELAQLRKKGVSPNHLRMQTLGMPQAPPHFRRVNTYDGGTHNGRPRNDPIRLLNASKLSEFGLDYDYASTLPRSILLDA